MSSANTGLVTAGSSSPMSKLPPETTGASFTPLIVTVTVAAAEVVVPSFAT